MCYAHQEQKKWKICEIWFSLLVHQREFLVIMVMSSIIKTQEKSNTSITTTAAESPWSSNINEKHNAILGYMIVTVKRDVGCSLNVVVVWTVSTKNSPANAYGYSPN